MTTMTKKNNICECKTQGLYLITEFEDGVMYSYSSQLKITPEEATILGYIKLDKCLKCCSSDEEKQRE